MIQGSIRVVQGEHRIPQCAAQATDSEDLQHGHLAPWDYQGNATVIGWRDDHVVSPACDVATWREPATRGLS